MQTMKLTAATRTWDTEPKANVLTRREREVAGLMARGLTNRQIATELVITGGTVGVHAEHILRKLGFHSRVEVATWVTEQGLRPARGD